MQVPEQYQNDLDRAVYPFFDSSSFLHTFIISSVLLSNVSVIIFPYHSNENVTPCPGVTPNHFLYLSLLAQPSMLNPDDGALKTHIYYTYQEYPV